MPSFRWPVPPTKGPSESSNLAYIVYAQTSAGAVGEVRIDWVTMLG